MKKGILISMAFLMLSACIIYIPRTERDGYSYPPQEEYARRTPGSELSEVYIYDYLSRYGGWVELAPYGYVWFPEDVHYGWRPYTRGRWVWTDYGWTWVSRFTWGWVPFHYGRWGWDDRLGWFWTVGTTWGPAWVTWRTGSRYIGWAPLPPNVRFIPGYGIRRLSFNIPSSYWVFVEGSYFYSDRMDRYLLPPERNRRLIRTTVSRTEIIQRDNRIINRGVDVDEIRRISRSQITKYQLEDAADLIPSRVEGNKVRMYRPAVERDPLARPSRIMEKQEALDVITKERIRKTQKDDEMDQRQERERELLEKTQEREIRDLKEKAEKTEKTGERQETGKVTQERIKELEREHQVEKSSLKKRQAEETEKVKKSESQEKKEEEKKEKTGTTKKKKDL